MYRFDLRTPLDTPYWLHDCADCIFLGGYIYLDDRYDLYFCTQRIGRPTLLARFGKNADYFSGLDWGKSQFRGHTTHPMAAAFMLAKLRGLIGTSPARTYDDISV